MAKTKKKKSAHTTDIPICPDYSNPRALEQYVSKVFASASEGAKAQKNRQEDGINSVYTDLDANRTRRRRRALLSTMDTARSHVSPVCPEISGIFYMEEEWTCMNALSLPGYDLIEQENHLTLGAALWLLDRIRDNGKLEEALRLLPADADTLNRLRRQSPPLLQDYDPGYGDEAILGTVSVLQSRNSDCTGLKKSRRAEKAEEFPRVFMDDYTALDKQHQSVPSRRRYEELLALARPEDLEKAAALFENKLWGWTEVCFACLRPILSEHESLVKEKEQYDAEVNRTLAEYEAEVDRRNREKKDRPDSGSASKLPPAGAADTRDDSGSEQDSLSHRFSASLEELRSRGDRLSSELQEISQRREDFVQEICECYALSSEHVKQLLGEDAAERIHGFSSSLEDPYELCFGLLYLIDRDSDLPWLYYPGVNLMLLASSRLPWIEDEAKSSNMP